ncbi:hypothetical protein B4135_1409 [Caldibacillus debilis]|uniref:Uncharacterized protein n=1 Tax=Caldibacillus debilis TaxID=301148 RepID=A0A150MDD3_9BACI|nr:hypothetical protein B4135_1409 [Caldibacillus debilis]
MKENRPLFLQQMAHSCPVAPLFVSIKQPFVPFPLKGFRKTKGTKKRSKDSDGLKSFNTNIHYITEKFFPQ